MKKTILGNLKLMLLGLFVSSSLMANAQYENDYSVTLFKIKIQPQSVEEVTQKQSLKSSTLGNYLPNSVSSVNKLNEKYKVQKMTRLFPDAGKYERKHAEHGLDLWYVVTVDNNNDETIINCISDFEKDGNIIEAEPYNNITQIKPSMSRLSGNELKSAAVSFPNDPKFDRQWHYHNTGQYSGTVGVDIDMKRAWEIEKGDSNVIVAVIDGGVDFSNNDLKQVHWTNYAELYGTPNVDDDNNGFIDDINGYNFCEDKAKIEPNIHGTHIAGTIGAATNNGIGVAGIAGGSGSGDGVKIMSCQVFGEGFSQGGYENAFIYAADNGAVIAQNSWGYAGNEPLSKSLSDAIDYFIDNAGYDENNNPVGPMQGGLVFFAAGNNGLGEKHYPAAYPKVMAVAASDNNDEKFDVSNYGDWVDITAPGVDVASTATNNEYWAASGTSMACPHVSGVAALIISHYNGITPEQVWSRLVYLSEDIDDLNPDYKNELGAGRLNAFNSLQIADEIPPGTISDLEVLSSGKTTITLTWTTPGGSADTTKAAVYDCRYSLEPINESNYANAHSYIEFKRPIDAGVKDTFQLKELLADTTYYIAIKTKDAWANTSVISNTVSFRTKIAPVLEMVSDSIYQVQAAFEFLVREYEVKNRGKEELTFNVDYYNPLNLDDFRGTKSANTVSESNCLYGIDLNSNTLNRINPTDGEQTTLFELPFLRGFSAFGLAYNGKYFYINGPNYNGVERVYVMNLGGHIVDSLTFPQISIISGLGVINGKLYVNDNQVNKIYEVDLKSKKVLRILTHGISFSLAMSAASDRKSIFIARDEIVEVDAQTGDFISSFLPGNLYTGLAYSLSEKVLFAGRADDIIDAIDPDTKEILYSFNSTSNAGLASDESYPIQNWMFVDNVIDTLQPGESTVVKMYFNSDKLYAGIYDDAFTINTNDPLIANAKIPVMLNVTGGYTDSNDIVADDNTITVYPNPATSTISIVGLPNGELVNIYTVSGKLVSSVVNETYIDVSNLTSGIYILKTESGLYLKFIKE